MPESPTVYLPRKLPPRNSSGSQSASHPVERRWSDSAMNEAPQSMRISITDENAPAVSVSSGLARQLQSSQRHIAPNDSAEVKLASFLLGYRDSEGCVCLNRLDLGIRSGSGLLEPTAMCDSDVVVPLYSGQSREMVFVEVLRPCRTNFISCWFRRKQSGTLDLEFVSVDYDICVSIVQAPSPINLGSLSSMLGQLRDRVDEHSSGWLREEEDGRFSVQFGTASRIRSRHAWALLRGSSGGWKSMRDAYIEFGAPESLHVVWIEPSQDWKSASIKHKRVCRVGSQSRLCPRVASVQLSFSQSVSHWRSEFSLPDMRDTGIASALRRVCIQFGVSLSSAESTVPPMAIASPTYSNTEPIAEVLQSLPRRPHFNPPADVRLTRAVSESGTSASSLDDLLEEQRHIRSLLEEQNRLIKTHVSQTREIIHYVRRQPPAHPVTRRYLRMKGVQSPSDANLLPQGTDDQPSPNEARRANSLSELVSEIRLFDVEGYEETEHIPRRMPSPSASVASSASSARVTSLVSSINSVVADSSERDRVPKYMRPPLPPPNRRPRPAALPNDRAAASTKVTPTTQKYLDSLSAEPRRAVVGNSSGNGNVHNNSGARRLARRITSLGSSNSE